MWQVYTQDFYIDDLTEPILRGEFDDVEEAYNLVVELQELYPHAYMDTDDCSD